MDINFSVHSMAVAIIWPNQVLKKERIKTILKSSKTCSTVNSIHGSLNTILTFNVQISGIFFQIENPDNLIR